MRMLAGRCSVLLGLLVVLAPVGAAVTPPTAGAAPATATCGGTVALPATLAAGTYASVSITGVCAVRTGQVTVTGDVSVGAGAALVTAYAQSGGLSGPPVLNVLGSIVAGAGASLILGCDPVHFTCFDDPTPGSPTSASQTTVQGSIVATDSLGVVIHDSTVTGDITETGGGGGLSCAPSTSVFSQTYEHSVYSDYENLVIGGNLRVSGVQSCWFGALRLTVGGSATFSGNTFFDQDANEILNNQISGNMLCTDLSPPVHFGDAGQGGSTVGGYGTGDCAFSRQIPYPNSTPVTYLPIASQDTALRGYWLGAADGGIFSFGVPFYGSSASQGQSIGGIAATPGGIGYQLASAGGSIFAEGPHPACTGSIASPNRPIVGVASAPGGSGCWTVASDGGIFSFGPQAPFYGSAGSIALNRPIVGMASAPSGDGYWMVASDGGIFSFGPGAAFAGSMGGQHLNQPIVGMAMDPSTGGYWMVASDGGIFSFNAPFLGSMGGQHLNQPIVGMAAAPGGDGYYLVASDGGIFSFGSGAAFQGSTGSLTLNRPIVGMALG